MSASLIDKRAFGTSLGTSNRNAKGDVASDRLQNRRLSLPAVTDEAEDRLIAKVAIVGAIVALTPFVLLHILHDCWPELIIVSVTPN